MKEKYLSVFDLIKQYQSEEDCLQAIQKMRWPNGFVCSHCKHNKGYRLHGRRVIQCVLCKKQTSITAGTIFHKTRISLVKWFWMLFLIIQDKGGASALRLSKQLDMHVKTVWNLLHKIRESMAKRDDEVIKLSTLIQMDEAYFGGPKRKTQVLVMIEEEKGRSGSLVMKKIFGQKVPSEPGIKAVIESRIDNESQQHFISDCAWAHTTPRKMGHTIQFHKSTPKSAVTDLGWLHLAVSLAKRFILGTYHGVSKKHLQKYLNEFCYRFNRRFKERHAFDSLIRACVITGPFAYLC
jgi:transposase-like protein